MTLAITLTWLIRLGLVAMTVFALALIGSAIPGGWMAHPQVMVGVVMILMVGVAFGQGA